MTPGLFPDPIRCAHGYYASACLQCARERAMDGSRDGETIEPKKDDVRLTKLMGRVFDCLSDGEWWLIPEITKKVGSQSEASVSARIRDLRKAKFGGHTVERERIVGGLYKYRLVLR